MPDITYFVALPFSQDEDGLVIPGTAEEFQGAAAAIRRAETLSRTAGIVGAVAFTRSGDPMVGEFNDATVLRLFGQAPDDLSAL